MSEMQTQLDLFEQEGEVFASRIFRDVISSILEAGGNLSSPKIQAAVAAARERTATLLDAQFSRVHHGQND
jgi:hypothetical protein